MYSIDMELFTTHIRVHFIVRTLNIFLCHIYIVNNYHKHTMFFNIIFKDNHRQRVFNRGLAEQRYTHIQAIVFG
jgi:hypothetical protein